MELYGKYKLFIMGFGILFFGFAEIVGIQGWGSIIFRIVVLLVIMNEIIEYAQKIGIVKFAILISILVVISGLTALIFINIFQYFIVSTIFKIVIIILGLVIDLLIIGYTIKKLGIKNVTLNKITKQVEVPDRVKYELKNLISEGKKIEAIKKYRMITGYGLIEAKEYIDSLTEQEFK